MLAGKISYSKVKMFHHQVESDSHASAHGSLANIFKVIAGRNFRLLWPGEGISLLGDQFYLVGLAWLTMQLTGSSLAVGTVISYYMVGLI